MTNRTIDDFGEQWTRYTGNDGYYGSVELLSDILTPLVQVADVTGANVAEIGSGTGRIVNMLLAGGATHVVAVEPSSAFEILRRNTVAQSQRVQYLHAPGDKLPPLGDRDLVVSIGVVHHIPDPDPVICAALNALRPGGRVFVCLYAYEGNETYLRIVNPLRKVTVNLPHWALAGLCHLLNLALDVYIALARILPVPLREYVRNVLGRFPRSTRHLVIYDQLNPAYAKYYRRAEALDLLIRNGFEEVACHHRHGYSWSVVGTKPMQQSGLA